MISKIISFSPVNITKLYLEKITEDMGNLTPSVTMQKIISEYFELKYGKELRDEVRNEFMKEYFND